MEKLIKKYSYYCLAIATSLSLTACTQNVAWECNIPAAATGNSLDLAQVTPYIYLDNTLSMQGFVSTRDSRYIQVLQSLDEVIATLSDRQPQYYSLGTTIQPLAGETASQIAATTNFYQQQQADSLLELALTTNSPQPNKLIILVTELLRANSDITPIIDAVKPYLQQNYSIGVLGVRSEFAGDIYDGLLSKQGTAQTIYFDTRFTEDLRPFYLIFIGKQEAIISYFEELKTRRSNLIDSETFLLIGEKVWRSPVKFEIEAEYTELGPGLTRVSEIYNRQVNMQIMNKQSVEFLQIRPSDTPAVYEYSIAYDSVPYTLPFTVKSQVESCLVNRENHLDDCETNQNVSEFLEFNLLPLTANTLNFVLKTRVSSGNDVIETVTLDVMVEQIQLPAWVKAWSYDERAKNESEAYLGPRTYRLENFLQNLVTVWEKELKDNANNPLGRFCFVVHNQ